MSDIFISYSRKDEEFAKHFYSKIQASGREAWMDLHKIPASADWLQQIERGIEGANSFVFILSPNSLASEICQAEVNHAIRYNKRLVPIVHQEGQLEPDLAAHQALKKLNWIFFCREDPFEHAFQKLLDTIDTDLEYVQEHTRLLERALEWERKNRSYSLLLRGDALVAAEEWLKEKQKKSQPTDAHQNYIAASCTKRKQEKRSRAGVGITALSIFSIGSYLLINVQERRTVADLEVAGNSALEAFRSSKIGALLTEMDLAEQLRLLVQQTGKSEYLASSPRLGLEAMLNEISHQTLLAHQDMVGIANFSSQGDRIVTVSSNASSGGHSVRVWDMSGSIIVEVKVSQDYILSAGVNYQGDRLVTISSNKNSDEESIKIWDLKGNLITEIINNRAGTSGASFSSQNDRIIATSSNNLIRIWDISGNLIVKLNGKDHLSQANLSPQGDRIVTSGGKTAQVWDLSGKLITEFQEEDGISSASFSPKGDQVITIAGKTTQVWNLSGKLITEFQEEDGISSASFSPKGDQVITIAGKTTQVWNLSGKSLVKLDTSSNNGGYDDNARLNEQGNRILTFGSRGTSAQVWDLSGKLIATIEELQDLFTIAKFNPEGNRILTVSQDRTVRLWDLSGKSIAEFKGHRDRVWDANFSPQGDRIVAASRNGIVWVWQTKDSLASELKGHGSTIYDANFSPQGDRIITTYRNGTARLWGLSGKLISKLTDNGWMTEGKFNRQGSHIITYAFPNGVFGTSAVWDVSGKLITRLKGVSASFNPKGDRVFTISDHNTMQVWSLSGNLITEFMLKGNQSDNMAKINFSPKGDQFVTVCEDKVACVWDLTGNLISKLKGHQDKILTASFNPQGDHIITASEDKTARLWDLKGNLVAKLIGHSDLVNSAGFSPKGDYIFTNSQEMTWLWNREGKLITKIKGSTSDFGFNSQGDRIVTTGDNTAYLWDIKGDLLAKQKKYQYETSGAHFNSQGNRIIFASGDSAYIWESATLDELLARGCQWLRTYLKTHPEELKKLETCKAQFAAQK
jgi:WD40 repeat protein